MKTTQIVRCPNCGSLAQRHHINSEQIVYRQCSTNTIIQTECPICDYLMVTCEPQGSVLESYTLGISVAACNSAFRPISNASETSVSKSSLI